MTTKAFTLPVCGFKSLDGSVWVNAPTADMLIEVLYPMIERKCTTPPEREPMLLFLEKHYPFNNRSQSLSQLAELLLLFCKKEENL